MGLLDWLAPDEKKNKKDDLDDATLYTVLFDTEKKMIERDLIEPTDFDDEVEDEDDYYYEDEK